MFYQIKFCCVLGTDFLADFLDYQIQKQKKWDD